MSSHSNMFQHLNYSDSDLDRAALRCKLLELGTSTTETTINIPDEEAQYLLLRQEDFESLLASSKSIQSSIDFADGTYDFPTDLLPYDISESIFEEIHQPQFETFSTDTSYAGSQHDGDLHAQSPTSPTFSAIMSSSSGPSSGTMSPDIPNFDMASLDVPASPSVCSEDINDESRALEILLVAVHPGQDGRFYCKDVGDEDHSCDFVTDRRCMLRKHLESNLKTNVCHHPDCNATRFSSKAVLTRHEKETHGMHAARPYFCPVEGCDRADRGFRREYNMGDHISRIHRELDVNLYVKKTKRTRKQSAAGSNLNRASLKTVAAPTSSTVQKSIQSRNRQDKFEKQYKASRLSMISKAVKLPETGLANSVKLIEILKLELARLEEAVNALATSTND